MISRVAESCFWLQRYIERMDNTARLLQVNRSFVLDVSLPAGDRWHPVLVVSGEDERFSDRYSSEACDDGEIVQEYLTWNEKNPASIASSLRWARENARSIREVISLEMWQSVNEFWHWMRGPEGRHLFHSDRDAFYVEVKEFCALFEGLCHGTMLRDEPYDFMSLGMLLERAAQTARVLDVKYHSVREGEEEGQERAMDAARCVALLRSCSASEPYFKRVRQPPRPRAVAGFLVLEETFPRSVAHGLCESLTLMERGEANGVVAGRATDLLRDLLASLRAHTPSSLAKAGVHSELTRIIDAIAEVCEVLATELFNPPVETETWPETATKDGSPMDSTSE